jgi:hypothetical protein
MLLVRAQQALQVIHLCGHILRNIYL